MRHRAPTFIIVAIAAVVSASACSRRSRETPREESTTETSSASERSRVPAKELSPPKGVVMSDAQAFVGDIEKLTTENRAFRRVLYTAKNMQLVVMALQPGEHIGLEVHDVDQFFRIESGGGEIIVQGKRSPVGPNTAMVVPAGSKHDVVNTGSNVLTLYTLYAPPHHRDGVVHSTPAAAEADTEHFDGKTTP